MRVSRLTHYLAVTIIQTTLLVLSVFLILEVFIALVGEFGDLGQGDYGAWQALIYVLLKVPQQIYMFFPMAGLLGSLLGLGNLATNSELIAMRSAGMSVAQISRAVLIGTFMMVFVVTLIGEFVSPAATHLAEKRKAIESSGGKALTTEQGMWIRADSSFIHIRAILPGRHIQGISIYQFGSDQHMKSASYAKWASYRKNQWYLHDVVQTIFKAHQLLTSHHKVVAWNVNLRPKWLDAASYEPDQMGLSRLNAYIDYLKANGLAYNMYAFVFWQRMFQPFAIAVMIMLAIPFIFGTLRSATMGLRIIVGVSVGFAFFILNRFLGPMSLVYQFPPILAAVTPTSIFALLGLWLMRRGV